MHVQTADRPDAVRLVSEVDVFCSRSELQSFQAERFVRRPAQGFSRDCGVLFTRHAFWRAPATLFGGPPQRQALREIWGAFVLYMANGGRSLSKRKHFVSLNSPLSKLTHIADLDSLNQLQQLDTSCIRTRPT